MVASGVLLVGAMRPHLSASAVTSRVVRGRLADFRTASAAARKVIGNNGNESNDGPVVARSSARVRQPGSPGFDRLGRWGRHRPDIRGGPRPRAEDAIRQFHASRIDQLLVPVVVLVQVLVDEKDAPALQARHAC
jgi:hypothetical protein